MMNEQRFVEMEIKLSYQEDLLQELNKIVAEQQQQIARLARLVEQMSERLESLAVDKKTNLEPPPPHY